MFGIVGIPLVDAGARFIAPAKFGDVVEIASQVSEFRRSSFDVAHRFLSAARLRSKAARRASGRCAIRPIRPR